MCVRRMRIALAQINSVVGDIDGNAARITDWLERARADRADLVRLTMEADRVLSF